MTVLHQRLRDRRVYLSKTLDEVAKELGVAEATVQRYESGAIKNIPHETIEQLAIIYDCNPAYLMGWVNDPTPTEEPKQKVSEPDPDIRMIARAREDMTVEDKKRMMRVLQAAFEEFFKDDEK